MMVRLESSDGKPVALEQEIPDGWTDRPWPPQLITLGCRHFIRIVDVRPPTYREAKGVYAVPEN